MRFNMTVLGLLGSLALLSVSVGEKAYADTTTLYPSLTSGYAGFFLGPSFVNDSVGTTFIVGGHVGAKLSPFVGVGFYGSFQNLASGSDDFGDSITLDETILAGELNIYPVYDVPVYFGAKVGVGITSVSGQVSDFYASASQANFAVGPALGFDIPVSGNFSLGSELNAIFLVDTGGSTPILINWLATANFKF